MSRIKGFSLGLAIAAGALHFPVSASADEEVKVDNPRFIVFHEMGRFENALSENVLRIKDQWVHRSGAWLDMKARKGEHLSLDLRVGGIYYTPTLEEADRQSRVRFFAGSVPRLAINYKFGDAGEPWLNLEAGVFLFRYNENVKNLGEYMFRTGTYPGWIQTGGLTYVGVNTNQLTGLKASQNFGSFFSHDLILNLETEVQPNYDAHLSYLARLKLGESLKLGMGLQLARILPAVPSKTNPDVEGNRYFTHQGTTYLDRRDYYQVLLQGVETRAKPIREQLNSGTASAADSAALNARLAVILQDTVLPTQALAVLQGIEDSAIAAPSYSHFKASGIKPVFWFGFDPKPLFGGIDMMGPQDLILYGEVAVLGVQDYPVLYPNIRERAPAMLGFNVPTFRLLDVLALEVEYYASKLPNSIRDVQNKAQPQPTLPPIGGYYSEGWTEDDWKWSVYAQRSVGAGFTISGQVARDHMRGFQFPTGKTDWTLLSSQSHWYWMLKFAVSI